MALGALVAHDAPPASATAAATLVGGDDVGGAAVSPCPRPAGARGKQAAARPSSRRIALRGQEHMASIPPQLSIGGGEHCPRLGEVLASTAVCVHPCGAPRVALATGVGCDPSAVGYHGSVHPPTNSPNSGSSLRTTAQLPSKSIATRTALRSSGWTLPSSVNIV